MGWVPVYERVFRVEWKRGPDDRDILSWNESEWKFRRLCSSRRVGHMFCSAGNRGKSSSCSPRISIQRKQTNKDTDMLLHRLASREIRHHRLQTNPWPSLLRGHHPRIQTPRYRRCPHTNCLRRFPIPPRPDSTLRPPPLAHKTKARPGPQQRNLHDPLARHPNRRPQLPI
jgi:hypothetical protein